jgi:hypothetical protein
VPSIEELDADTAIEVAENSFAATQEQAEDRNCGAARAAFAEGGRAMLRATTAIRAESRSVMRNLMPTFRTLPAQQRRAQSAIRRFCS